MHKESANKLESQKLCFSVLVGYSTSGSMTMGRYDKRYQPKVLLDALMLLDYGDMGLS
jgi:hypothetical protein